MGSSVLAALLLLLLQPPFGTGGCDKIYNAMYSDLVSVPCVRLLTKNGEIGCSTDGRVEGTLRLYDNDFQAVLSSPPDGKVAVAVPQALFNKSVVDELRATMDLAGILVLTIGDTPTAYSPDEKTPQSFMAKIRGQNLHEWNLQGHVDPIIHQRYGFGIVVADKQGSEEVYEKAKDNEQSAKNGDFQAFVAEFNYPMYANGNSIDCLKRATCLPVGGFSVWTTLDRLNATSNRKVVLATAVGANFYQSGLVALLGAVKALNQFNSSLASSSSSSSSSCLSLDQVEKKIMVAILQGEQFGYVGSRRFAKDLKVGLQCEQPSHKYSDMCVRPYKPSTLFTNINLTQIDSIIEVGAIGSIGNDGRGGGNDVFVHRSHLRIPSFLEMMPPSMDVGAIHISDSNSSFKDPFFLSRYDTNITASQRLQLCDVARSVARLLYGAAGGGESANVSGCLGAIDSEVDCEHIIQLFDCFTQDQENGRECAKSIMGDDSSSSTFQSDDLTNHYTSVFLLVDPPRIGGFPAFLHSYLAKMLIEANGFGAAYHDAVDPVIEFDYAKDKWYVRGGEAWSNNVSAIPSMIFTESNWAFGIGTRLFRRESPETQLIMLTLGLVLTTLAGLDELRVAVRNIGHYFKNNDEEIWCDDVCG
eukprot:jgi/Bigna1/75787/fgenesh1_pg.37_\